MIIKEVEAKSLLRKHKKIDSWFISRYGMNFYRGCQHACAYCDGQAEGYYVESDFTKEVEVKINAPELLRRELDPARKRKPLKKGFVILGGGISDSYQARSDRYVFPFKSMRVSFTVIPLVMMKNKLPCLFQKGDFLQNIGSYHRVFVYDIPFPGSQGIRFVQYVVSNGYFADVMEDTGILKGFHLLL